MIGYNENRMDTIVSSIMPSFDRISHTKTKITASFYKILLDYNDTYGIDKDVFFILFCMAFAAKRNVYSLSDRTPDVIYRKGVIPDLNRALYNQDIIRRRISKPSDIPSWILYSMEAVGNDNLFTVLVTFAVWKNRDIEDMFPDSDRMSYLLNNTSLLSREKFITFGEIKNAREDYESRQV